MIHKQLPRWNRNMFYYIAATMKGSLRGHVGYSPTKQQMNYT